MHLSHKIPFRHASNQKVRLSYYLRAVSSFVNSPLRRSLFAAQVAFGREEEAVSMGRAAG